jgi:formate dehydrogenase subunit gamma
LGHSTHWCNISKIPPEDSQEASLAEFEDWSEERAEAIIAARAGEPGATLPILHDLQAAFGYVPAAAVPLVAQALNLTRAEVHGVVSFYHDYRRHKPGRHVLHLCRAEACQALGAQALASHVKARLNIGWHATTSDGAVTLEPVFCLGLCAIGPAAMLDNEPLARLDATRVRAP